MKPAKEPNPESSIQAELVAAFQRIVDNLNYVETWWEASEDLRFLEVNGVEAAPFLAARIDDADPKVCRAAVVCLGRINQCPEITIPALVRYETSKNRRGGYVTLHWLAGDKRNPLLTIDESCGGAVADLADWIDHATNDKQAMWAFQILARIGRPAVPALRRLLKSPSNENRIQAAQTLSKIGEAAVDAGPDLVEMLRDENKYIRFCALESLSCLGPGVYSFVPAIAEHLDDHASVVWSGFFDGLRDPENTSELEAEAWHRIPAAALAAIQAITGHHEEVYSKNWWLEWIHNHPTGSTGK